MRLEIVLLMAGAVWGQNKPPTPVLPEKHPPLPEGARHEQAARLTAEVAGAASESQAAPVPRKNFIDDFIFSKMERDGIPHAPLATDEEFVRRVHIDLTGRIPDDARVREFLASKDPNKRDKLVDELVGSPAYKAKWTYWVGDLAMTAANRVGNAGKNLFYQWVYDNIHLNRPWNEFVQDLVTTTAVSNWYIGPASYIARWVVIGVRCEDTVHEDTSDELAIRTARDFLGVDLNCISCHDGAGHLEKINLWLSRRKREDLWKMAAYFGKTRVLRRVEVATTRDEYSIDDRGPGYDASARSVVRVPRRGKGMVEPVFLFNGEKPDPTRPLRPQYAHALTEHPQFARATVNRFWAAMMGAGIVEPVTDFDLARLDPRNPPPAPWTLQPTHPELLEALAEDFRKNGYDIQRLLKLIAKSSTYQLSSKFPGQWKAPYARYYARKFVRRLSAEELYDSIVQATNLFTPIAIRGTDLKVKFAAETRSPEDFKYNNLKDINFFLEVFGQTNREYSERKEGGTITQAILMMNSPWVMNQIKAAPGSFLAQLNAGNLNEEQKITRLFERFLSRRPSPEEMAMAKDVVLTYGLKGWEELQWLLVNKLDFLFNQ